MIRKLLFTILICAITITANAFDNVKLMMISSSGTGYNPMYTTDGVLYHTIVMSSVAVNTHFRINDVENWGNHNWGFAWGGTAVLNGSSESIPANTCYIVHFNIVTKKYTYQKSVWELSSERLEGTFNNSLPLFMATLDGINYSADNFDILNAGTGVWSGNYSSAAFPEGNAILNGPHFNIPAGTYNISYNKISKAYKFDFVRVGLTGPAFGGWNTDTFMNTTDGVNYTLTYSCNAGEAKFRLNNVWNYNYGGVFPNATGEWNGINIQIPAGTYNITFNRLTHEYSFNQGTASVTDVENKAAVNIFPNPANDRWNFDSTKKIDGIDIYDATGKKVYTSAVNAQTATIDLTAFESGIYLAKVTFGDKVQQLKLIKQ